jgi:hypothetical protein
LLRLGLATVTALLLFGRQRLRPELQALAGDLHAYTTWWPWYGAHLVILDAVMALLFPALEGRQLLLGFPGGDRILLILGAAAALLCWGKAVMPLRLWPRLLWRGRRTFLSCLLIGAAALAAGRLSERLWEVDRLGLPWVVAHLLTPARATFFFYGKAPELVSSQFTVRMDSGAAGFECFGQVGVYLGCFLWMHRRQLRFRHVILLVPLVGLLTWLAAALRVGLLFQIGHQGCQGLATELFRSHVGALAFNLLTLGTLAWGCLPKPYREFSGESSYRRVRLHEPLDVSAGPCPDRTSR